MNNLSKTLFDRNKNHSTKTAFVEEHKSITYGELEIYSRCIASWMTTQQINPGDRVAIIYYDKIDSVAVFLATILIGAIPVLISPRGKPNKIQTQLASITPKLVCIENDLDTSLISYKTVTVDQIRINSANTTPYNDANALAETNIATMIFTSGTTGYSKPVMYTHERLMLDGQITTVDYLKVTSTDKLFCAAKLYTGFGFIRTLIGTLYAGASAYLLADISSPVALRKILKNFCPTLFFAAPIFYTKLIVKNQKLTLDCRYYCAGSNLSLQIIEQWKNYTDRNLHNLFGTTECCSAITVNLDGDSPAIGTPTTAYQLRIVDNDNILVADGTVGRLQVKSSLNGVGYFDDPEWTEKIFKEWIPTGDLCYKDSKQHYYYVGRVNSIVKINGSFVNLTEIDDMLSTYTGVEQAATIATSDENGNDQLEAYIVPDDDSDINLLSLKSWMIANYEKNSCPKKFYIVNDLPTTESGKIEKYKLSSTYTV